MSNPFHVVTNIKKQIDEAQHKTHEQFHMKKQLKYYSLFLKEIITIQRFYRNHLIRKQKKLEQKIDQQLKIKQCLEKESDQLDHALKHSQMKRIRLKNSDVEGIIESQKQNIQSNIRKVIQNVMNSADNFAQNSAISRIYLNQFRSSLRQQEQLEAEVKELKLQKQCHLKRMQGWKDKLQNLRRRIMEESSQIRQLERQLR